MARLTAAQRALEEQRQRLLKRILQNNDQMKLLEAHQSLLQDMLQELDNGPTLFS
jgi:hypothetical protein